MMGFLARAGLEVGVTMDAAVGKLGRELRRLKDGLEAVRVTVTENRPTGDVLLVDRLGETMEDLVGWSAEASEAAQKIREAVVGKRVKWRLVRQRLGVSERSFHHASQTYHLLVSYQGMAELMELANERNGDWPAWVRSVRQGLEACRLPLTAVEGAYLECWEEIAEG